MKIYKIHIFIDISLNWMIQKPYSWEFLWWSLWCEFFNRRGFVLVNFSNLVIAINFYLEQKFVFWCFVMLECLRLQSMFHVRTRTWMSSWDQVLGLILKFRTWVSFFHFWPQNWFRFISWNFYIIVIIIAQWISF